MNSVEQHIEKAISRARRRSHLAAFFYLDLDDFKEIGHGLDKVLHRLEHHMRVEETSLHIGQDEFLVIVDDIEKTDQIAKIAEKILNLFTMPFESQGKLVNIKTSIGIAVYPDDGESAHQLLSQAEMATWQAKTAGKNCYRFANEKFNQVAEQNHLIANYLPNAIHENEFKIMYEPIFDLATNRVTAVEALLTWESPILGSVPVNQWLPIASEIGLLTDITAWEFKKACEAVDSWHHHHIRLHINITKALFMQDIRYRELHDYIQTLKITADHIVLKMDENLVANFRDHHPKQLKALCELGFNISIDHYGRGVSSVSQLQTLCISSLRLDKTYVAGIGSDPASEALAISTITLAHGLGYKAVAPCVETESQLKFLKHHQCDLAQGEFLSKPLNNDGIAALLASLD